jgi:hypothetical protein
MVLNVADLDPNGYVGIFMEQLDPILIAGSHSGSQMSHGGSQ